MRPEQFAKEANLCARDGHPISICDAALNLMVEHGDTLLAQSDLEKEEY